MRLKRFDEKNLTFDELSKKIKTGETRGEVLVKKIETEEPITFKPDSGPDKGKLTDTKVSNKEEVIRSITKNSKFDANLAKNFFLKGSRYKKVIHGEDDVDYKLNDIEKTIEFGSSGGSSLGFKETRFVECIQCFFMSFRQSKKRTIEESDLYNLNDTKFKNIMKSVRIPSDVASYMSLDFIEKYTIVWGETFINTANALYDIKPVFTKDNTSDDNVLSRSRRYIFYQIGYDGGVTEAIYEKYRSLPETTGIPISKWTPSDMWAVNAISEYDIIRRISSCETIVDLNNLIDLLFSQKNLRGISLKKIKDIQNVKLIFNKVTPRPKYTFNKVNISTNPFSSIGIKILADRESDYVGAGVEIMDVRTYSGSEQSSDVSGEVLGESARHGKVGLSRINSIISNISKSMDISVDLVPTRNQIDGSKGYVRMSDEQIKQSILDSYQYLDGKASKTGRSVDKVDTRSRLISKYQSLKLAEILYKNKAFSDKIIQSIFYYAMAIENISFVCPKYVRII